MTRQTLFDTKPLSVLSNLIVPSDRPAPVANHVALLTGDHARSRTSLRVLGAIELSAVNMIVNVLSVSGEA